MALTLTSQAEFTEALANEGKELVFFIHGFSSEPKGMVVGTDNMQTNFNLSPQKPKNKEVLVVPVDWACTDPKGSILTRYHRDQENSAVAGTALWKLFSGLKKNSKHTLNVIAHSMGNRVLRFVGKSAVDGDASWNEGGLQDKTLLQAAPEDLQSNENLFDNIFFVSADIPATVFEKPDGPQVEQAEHALQSGVAALAVMTKRMHVLHAQSDLAMTGSALVMNQQHTRLGWMGPHAEVWDKIGDALEKYEGIEADGSVNKGNVHVLDCDEWNTEIAEPLGGHSYQFAPKSVAYYLKHVCE